MAHNIRPSKRATKTVPVAESPQVVSTPSIPDESAIGPLPTFQGTIITRGAINPRFGGRQDIGQDTGLPFFGTIGTTKRRTEQQDPKRFLPFDPRRGLNVGPTGQPLRPLSVEEIQGRGRQGATQFRQSITDPTIGRFERLSQSIGEGFAEAFQGVDLGIPITAPEEARRLDFERQKLAQEQFIENVVEPLTRGAFGEVEANLLRDFDKRDPVSKFIFESIGDPTNLITGGTLALTRKGGTKALNLTSKGLGIVGNTIKRPSSSMKATLGIDPIDLTQATIKQTIRAEAESVVGQAIRGVPIASQDELTQIGGRIISQRTANTPNITSNATVFTEKLNARYVDDFTPLNINEQGQLTNLTGIDSTLPGAPTIQDVAANLPLYFNQLSTEQKETMGELKRIFADYTAMLDEVGIEVGQRLDIQPGGFYIPRGPANVGDLDEPLKVGRRGGLGGKTGSERQAFYKSMADGIEDGAEYASFKEVLAGFFDSMGHRINDQLTLNVLKTEVDPTTGIKLSQTASDRVPGSLRVAHNKLLNQISSTRNTLRNQVNRLKAQIGEAERNTRRAETAAGRTENAGQRAGAAEAAYDAVEAKGLRGQITRLVSEGRHFSFDYGQQIQQLRASKQKLTAGDLKMQKDFERVSAELDENQAIMNAMVADPRADPEHLFNLYRDSVVLDTQLDELFNAAQPLYQRVDDLIEKGIVQKNLIAENRSSTSTARKSERLATLQNRSVHSLNREMKLLANEQVRAERIALQAQQRGLKTAFRSTDSKTKLGDLQTTLNNHAQEWQAAIAKSQQVPAGRARIPGIPGHDFPAELAREVARGLEGKGTLRKFAETPLDVVNFVNRMYRTFGATGDNSAPFIQGLLLMGSNLSVGIRALKVNARTLLTAFSPGKDSGLVYGRYLRGFDEAKAARGRLTSDQWANFRLHQGIGEFQLGTGDIAFEDTLMGNAVTSRVLRSGRRIARESNIAFNNFTNTARLEWADDMLQVEMSKGRNLDEIVESGDMHQIASIANSMTGHADEVAFANYQELLLFAPRFLQSRMATLGNALIGSALVPAKRLGLGIGPEANLKQRQAARSMTRMIAWAVMMTNVINEAQGRETDWRPLIDDPNGGKRRNPNFMRIRGFGRDWSLLGTWDSLAGAIISIGTGNPEDALRNMGSGALTIMWDKMSGSDPVGNPVPGFKADPIDQAAHIMENLVPFSSQELGTITGDALKGVTEGSVSSRASDVATGVVSITGEMLGIKSSPLSLGERIDDARDNKRIDMGLESDFRGLTGAQQDEIDADPDIAELLKERVERNRDRGSVWQEFQDGNNDIFAKATDTKESLALELGPGDDYRKALGAVNTETAISLQQRRDDFRSDLQFFDDLDRDQSEFEIARQEYITRTRGPWLDNEGTGTFNFQALKVNERELRDKYGDVLIDQIEADLNRNDPPLEQLLTTHREILEPYWQITRDTMQQYAQGKEFDAFFTKEGQTDPDFLNAPGNEGLKFAFDRSNEAKREFRKNNPDIERLLWLWGYIKTPVSASVGINVEQLRQQDGGTIQDRLRIFEVAAAGGSPVLGAPDA